jgi:hypothetical protein
MLGQRMRGVKDAAAARMGLTPGRALMRQRGALGGAARFGARAGRFVPGGALAFGAVDAGMRMAQGESIGKALGGAAASTIGATLGGILGQAIIPVPGVGAAIGMAAGGLLGDKVFSALWPASQEQKTAAAKQLQAAQQQLQAAGISKSGVDVDAAGGQFLFGKTSELALRLNELGMAAQPAVRSFQALYRLDQEKQQKAQAAATALNTEITRLKNLGRPQEEIASRVKGLQSVYNRAKSEAQTSLTNLNKSWSQIGTKSTAVILNSFRTMPLGQVDAAIAERIKNAGGAAAQNGGRGGGGSPGGLNPSLAPTPTPSPGGTYRGGQRGGRNSYAGSLGDAISKEMRMKPPGSSLVVANSSETIIPAAKGYGMSDFMGTLKTGFNEVIAQVKYGGGRGAKPGGGSANWMQILEQDYLKNLNKPIPGGPVRGSGRGGLDVWEGPQASYISPSSLQTTASRAGGGSSPVSINSPITIYQQPGQDSEELAAVVLEHLGTWVSDARASSIFV